jgi:NTP pyrophosphatase (non-canonical NTP hydrolase)
MNFDEYMKLAWNTAIYPKAGDNLYYPTLGLSGEAGEVANKVKKVMRDFNDVMNDDLREAIKDELGDTLWYVAALCIELGVTMDDVAECNIKKLRDRKTLNKIKGSGDKR